MSDFEPSGSETAGWSRSSAAGSARWDAAVRAFDGSVLQSWRWGEWYRRGGWRVERIRVEGPKGTGLAQLLLWPEDRPTEARLARGPMLAGDLEATARELFGAIDEVCAPHGPLTLTVEPPAPVRSVVLAGTTGFTDGAERWCCPGRTVEVPLLDDHGLLQRMRSKTRQQVRQPERRGVWVERAAPNGEALETFYGLLEGTARRNEFDAQPLAYYESFLRILEAEAVLLLARTGEGVAAGLIMTCFGNEAIAHFSGSSAELRVPGLTAYLYFEGMRLARARGCTRFDLWGIPDENPAPVEGAQPAGSRGGDWGGIHHFKMGLGGDVVTYPPLMERHYQSPRREALGRRD